MSPRIPAAVLAIALFSLLSPAIAETILVTNEQDSTVSLIDGATLRVVATIPVGRRPPAS